MYATKSEKGLLIWQDIVGKYSSEEIDGIPTYIFKEKEKQQQVLFNLDKSPMEVLQERIISVFSKRKLSVHDIIKEIIVTQPSRTRDIKSALKSLEAHRLITIEPPAKDRRPNQLSDNAIVVVPEGKRMNAD